VLPGAGVSFRLRRCIVRTTNLSMQRRRTTSSRCSWRKVRSCTVGFVTRARSRRRASSGARFVQCSYNTRRNSACRFSSCRTKEEFMRTRTRLSAVLAVLLFALMQFYATAAMAQEKSRLQTVLERGKLVVATFSTAPPFCFTDEKGQLVGFDIDVARLLATALFKDPTKVDFVVVTAEGRWPAIESGRADMGIATTTIYPDRALRVAFTRPYVDTGVAVLVRKDSGIKSLADFNQDKFTIAN